MWMWFAVGMQQETARQSEDQTISGGNLAGGNGDAGGGFSAGLGSMLRHLLSGGAAFLVDLGLVSATEADEWLRLVVAALVIVISRLVMWALGKYAPGLSKLFVLKGNNNALAMAFMGVFAMAGASLLTSCSSLEGVTGTIFLRDPDTGAKGGLHLMPGEKPSAFVRVPFKNEDGEVIGWADLDVGKMPEARDQIPELVLVEAGDRDNRSEAEIAEGNHATDAVLSDK